MELPLNPVKRFVFRSRKQLEHDPVGILPASSESPPELEVLEVIVPERMQASYGLYVWPSAPILAWYLFENRHHLPGKRVLELGAGTALPGVVAALLGAQVTLSDSAKLPHCLEQCHRTATINGVGDKVKVIGLTWGLFLNSLTQLKGQVDLLLGSDCFYDPSVFEDLISTVAYILGHNPKAKFLTTYQERSADWSIEHLLKKWGLHCKHVPLNNLANSESVDLLALMQDHTIHLLEITSEVSPNAGISRDNDIEIDHTEFP
ncbi:unnamed protein product [Orchesella dallaii]|uniref:Methyltransferase-like protein 23 n=1 Tax=Orchesella dallaii TaxID=48710 RepID=A0ABP1PL03_9HEXA